MSIIEHTTTITPSTVRNMKRYKLEDCLLLFANKSVTDEAEIEHLKAELDLREKLIEQAKGAGSLHIATITEDNASEIYDGWRNVGKTVILGIGSTEKFIAGYEDSEPELYAHLARMGE